jgi:NADH-quinone oxidoreductase subunit G
LVPGYGVSRLNLLAGNDVATKLPASLNGLADRKDLVFPASDTLFTSGTLGRYSAKLNEVMESHEPAETAAD